MTIGSVFELTGCWSVYKRSQPSVKPTELNLASKTYRKDKCNVTVHQKEEVCACVT